MGQAGLLERMAIGVRVLEAIGRPALTKAKAREGLEQAGLSWRDLLVPAVPFEAIDRDVPHSLGPLARVVERLAAIKEPTARGAVVRDLLGDHGIEWIEDLSRSLAAPADEARAAERAAALARVGVMPEDLATQPLAGLAKVITAIDQKESNAVRRAEAVAFFGTAADRLEALAKELSLMRALVVLDDLGLDQRRLAAAGPRAAFDALSTAVAAEPDQAKRARILLGLLGAEGPTIYATATAVNEGIDHAWVFRYEIDEDSVEVPEAVGGGSAAE